MRRVPLPFILSFLFLASCSEPVATGLDGQEVNQVLGVLSERGIAATKQLERSGAQEGTWTVMVGGADAASASEALRQHELPRPRSTGLAAMMDADPLFPSPAGERARWAAGTAAELERSLEGLSGVLSARVHLALPPVEPFHTEDDTTKPSASVLLRYSADTPPLSSSEVQRLIAGAVPKLSPGAVEVVETKQAGGSGGARGESLARLGPVTVTRSALGPLRSVAMVAVATNLAAIGLALFLWVRLRRAQIDLQAVHRPDSQPPPLAQRSENLKS